MPSRFSKEMAETLGAEWANVQLVNEDMDVLGYLKTNHIPFTGQKDAPKTHWQIELYSECALHRIVLLARGCVEAWNSSNVLVAFLSARSLVETVVCLWDFSEQIIRMTAEQNLIDLRKFVQHKMFASKEFKTGAEELQVVNVLTLVNKFEREIPGIRTYYDDLSEYCHPNYFGLYGMFSTVNLDQLTANISENLSVNLGSFSKMMKSMTLLSVVPRVLGQIDENQIKLVALMVLEKNGELPSHQAKSG